MIYLLNDIKFGHPKLSKYQIDYFEKHLIPLILKKGGDKIIINGDLFYNNKHVTFGLLAKVRNILKQLSIISIEIVNNEYCFEIINDLCTKINNFEYDTSNISLFQFTKENDKEIGFHVIKDKPIFVPNNKTPRFTEYNINSIEDLETVKLNGDFIDLVIDANLLNNQSNKNKIDLFLNNNPSINVYYTIDKEEKDDKVKLDTKNINLRSILLENVDENLIPELSEIFKIYDSKT